VEEAPSPFLDEATRKAMGEQSVALAKAVDYQSAGTVEFIVDRDRNFYFLEMNTRLQVEHPVTELVTSIDLVEQMIRVAAGEKLPFKQADIKLNGWAIESRLYAEDPYRNFLPSIGRLTRYRPPREGKAETSIVRNDTGVYEGAEISMYYDPMIAKLCTWAPKRLEAIEAMGEALDGFVVDGIEHNMPFLSALMKHPRWREGRLSTGFIAEEYPDGFAPVMPDEEQTALLSAIALSCGLIESNRRERYGDRLRPAATPLRESWVVKLGANYLPVTLLEGVVTIPFEMDMQIGTQTVTVATDWRPGDSVWAGTVGGRKLTAQIRTVLNGLRIDWQGISVRAKVFTPRQAELDKLMPVKLPPDTSKLLLCPMPGLVVAIAVAEGQEVKAGETLAIIEAMKMENVLRAERDLVIGKINAKPGESLAVDAVIMEFA
jgi:propionyl-CoA carboxylase alpha chain